MTRIVALLLAWSMPDAFAGVAVADLSITKTDGSSTATPGESTTYTITVHNAGPDAAPGCNVQDTLPAAIVGATWSCPAGSTACPSPGQSLSDTLQIGPGVTVIYTLLATVDGSATGSMSNTATVSCPASDPNGANNSATDTDTLGPSADLSVTVTDGETNINPGDAVTWTVTVANAGPSDVVDAEYDDTPPPSLADLHWTCVGTGGGTCAASGSASINDTPDLPAGASVIYTVDAIVADAAVGTLVYTGTIASPVDVPDPTPGNNWATDTDTITPFADLRVTNTDGVETLGRGQSSTWTIVASNDGPVAVTDAHVQITVPATLTGATWTCDDDGGGTCGAASGIGSVDDATVDLPVGASTNWTLTATKTESGDDVVVTATISSSTVDPNASNSTMVDTDAHLHEYDAWLALEATGPDPIAGDSLSIHLDVTNDGPDTAPEVVVDVTFDAAFELGAVPLGCTLDGGQVATCTLVDIGVEGVRELVFAPTIAEATAVGAELTVDAALALPDTTLDDDDTATVTVTVGAVPDTGGDDTGDDEPSCGCRTGGSPTLSGAILALALARRRSRT